MERLRLFISQFIASIVVAVSAIWFCRNIITCTRLVTRFFRIEDYIISVSVVLLIGIFTIGVQAIKVILWLMRDPMLAEQEDLGTIENVPENK